MQEQKPNNHEILIEEIHKIRDRVMTKTKHTGLTNRTVLLTVVEMFEVAIAKLKS